MSPRPHLALVLLWLLVGCAPAGPPKAARPTQPLEAIAVAAEASGPVQLQVHLSPATAELGPSTLVLECYPSDRFSPQDFPLVHTLPSFRWVSPKPVSTWPWQGSLDLPLDGLCRLVAWLDLNGSGQLDLGDHVAQSLPPLMSSTEPQPLGEPAAAPPQATLTISRIYVARAAMARHVPVRFEFLGDAEATYREQGRLLLQGFSADQVQGKGFPPSPPVFSWRSPSRERAWPAYFTIEVPIEPSLWLFPVLLDGNLEEVEFNSRYGAPDGPLVVAEITDRPVALRIDQAMVMTTTRGERAERRIETKIETKTLKETEEFAPVDL